jgi:uncharacterized protein YjeT (DUF2065 family)
MALLAQLLGVLIVSLGIAVLFKPKILKIFSDFWVKDKRLYLAGILRMMCGFILLLAAPKAKLFWLVTILGLLCLAKGILLFALKPGRIKSLINWWNEQPIQTIRALAILAIALGAWLIYAI